MVVRHPIPAPVGARIWAGRLTEAAVATVLDSPKRQEVAQHLVDSDAAVWIILESGDQSADDTTAETLKRTLQNTTDALSQQFSASDPATSSEKTPPPRFPIIRVSRKDPGERVFVDSLLAVEPDLGDYTDPIVIPIFGRGRALYALVGRGINADTVRKSCDFLVGWCSCEVKDQNPGMDMLMSVDWDGRVGKTDLFGDAFLSQLPGVPQRETLAGAVASGETATEAGPPVLNSSTVETNPGTVASPILRNLAFVLSLGAILVAAVSVALWRRGANSHE
jgi:hypothetical protein